MFKIGDKVWYRGDFGSGASRPGVVVGVDEKDGELVYDVKHDRGINWGYADQVSRR